MALPSDSELQKIVTRVVQRTVGAVQAPQDHDAGQADAVSSPETEDSNSSNLTASAPGAVAIGADHGGYSLKEALKVYLRERGYNVVDCGTHSSDSVDYPDFASAVARLVSEAEVWRGIIIDGAGIGSCMVANKWPGVRAAMCYDHATALNSREHNNANVLTLGAGFLGENLARQIVAVWLETSFAGGRHTRRVEKINALEIDWVNRKS